MRKTLKACQTIYDCEEGETHYLLGSGQYSHYKVFHSKYGSLEFYTKSRYLFVLLIKLWLSRGSNIHQLEKLLTGN